MGLDWNGAGRLVNHGSSASLDNIYTGASLMWVYADSTTNGMEFTHKGIGGAPYPHYLWVNWSSLLIWEIARATTKLQVSSAPANFANYGTGKWCCIAWTWDTTGVNGDQKIAIGDLTNALAEPSAYASQAVGSGAGGDNSANDFVTGSHPTGSGNFAGDIALLAVWNTNLSLAQLEMQRMHLSPVIGHENLVLFCNYGFNGTGSQFDISGNGNHGTVTGATFAHHVPLAMPMSGIYVHDAAVPAAQTMPIISSAGIHNAVFDGLVVQGAA